MKQLKRLIFFLSLLCPVLLSAESGKAALAVFVSNPDTRDVKKHLAQDFSSSIARNFYRHCLDVLTDDLEGLSRDFSVVICPAREEADRPWAEQRWPEYSVLTVDQFDTMGQKIRAVTHALFQQGYSEVLVIGSDSPSLPPYYIYQCQDLLTGSDVVLGPAQDGGYYLIGCRQPLEKLNEVRWSSRQAFAQTKKTLMGQGLTVASGPRWYDVDEARELWQLEVDLVGCRGCRAHLLSWVKTLPHVSVVIPVLNERRRIPALVEQLNKLDPRPEILFVDGGSRDGTVATILDNGITPIQVVRGNRGASMNAGIVQARAPVILFLHADTLISQEAYSCMLEEMNDSELVGGAFTFALAGSANDWRKRFIESMVGVRNFLFNAPYGDQAYFVRKSALDEVGLFKDIELMEDVEWFSRLKDSGKYVILEESVATSGRRIFKRGWVRSGFLNMTLLSLYKAGVSPKYLAKWYYGSDDPNCEDRELAEVYWEEDNVQ